jgi:hypothetical protein
MIAYKIACLHCKKEEHHGFTRPETIECHTTRLMRTACRDMGCKPEIVEYDYQPSDVDALRLGLREDVAIA